jgi:hypothetical protein
VLASRAWAAYPAFSPPEAFPPFTLAPGLCYANAGENAASAMEVAAVAAKNCALKVQAHLAGGGGGGGRTAAGGPLGARGRRRRSHLMRALCVGLNAAW